jgi:hypothetical protein
VASPETRSSIPLEPLWCSAVAPCRYGGRRSCRRGSSRRRWWGDISGLSHDGRYAPSLHPDCAVGANKPQKLDASALCRYLFGGEELQCPNTADTSAGVI